jgi:hypothetical protein
MATLINFHQPGTNTEGQVRSGIPNIVAARAGTASHSRNLTQYAATSTAMEANQTRRVEQPLPSIGLA